MKKIINIFFVALLALSFFACEDDEDNKQTLFSGAFTIDASDYENWVYFSFEAMDIATIANPATSAEWDIAFHRADFRTNSGAAGTANGGVIDMGVVEMNTVTDIPSETFVVDDTINIMESSSMPPSYIDVPGSKILTGYTEGGGKMGGGTSHDGAFIFDMNTFSYNPSNKVFILRCADGNSYAKLKFTDYRSAVIDFEYEYTIDATKGFTE
jgi:hypothetical protein